MDELFKTDFITKAKIFKMFSTDTLGKWIKNETEWQKLTLEKKEEYVKNCDRELFYKLLNNAITNFDEEKDKILIMDIFSQKEIQDLINWAKLKMTLETLQTKEEFDLFVYDNEIKKFATSKNNKDIDAKIIDKSVIEYLHSHIESVSITRIKKIMNIAKEITNNEVVTCVVDKILDDQLTMWSMYHKGEYTSYCYNRYVIKFDINVTNSLIEYFKNNTYEKYGANIPKSLTS